MLHAMKLQPFSFDRIKKGNKIIEVRLYDEKRRDIKIWDVIEFKRESEQAETVKAEVTGLLNYKTFTDLAIDFPSSYFIDIWRPRKSSQIYFFQLSERKFSWQRI